MDAKTKEYFADIILSANRIFDKVEHNLDSTPEMDFYDFVKWLEENEELTKDTE